MVLFLLACGSATSGVDSSSSPAEQLLHLQATVRRDGEGAKGLDLQAWVGASDLPMPPDPRPGECVSLNARPRGEALSSPPTVKLGQSFALVWNEPRGHYGLPGASRGPDPAWLEGDLSWGRKVVPAALRFGAAPELTTVERRPDGGLRLRWEAEGAGQVQVATEGLRCGATRDGVDLPWWAVPAWGGEVLLRSTRLTHIPMGATLVVGEAVIETVILLDRPTMETPSVGPRPPTPRPSRLQLKRRRMPVG